MSVAFIILHVVHRKNVSVNRWNVDMLDGNFNVGKHFLMSFTHKSDKMEIFQEGINWVW